MRPPGGILAPGESLIATGIGLALALLLQMTNVYVLDAPLVDNLLFLTLDLIIVFIFFIDYGFGDGQCLGLWRNPRKMRNNWIRRPRLSSRL